MSARGGRGGGRGNKRNPKGGRRHFTNPDELKAQAEKEEKRKQWRQQQGIESDEDEEEEEEIKKEETKEKSKKAHGAPGELPPSSSEEDSEEESSEEEDNKPKGVAHLINIENPNRVKAGPKKATAIDTNNVDKTQLTRREREEIEKQEAHARYMKKHLAGETQEAQADLARLALVRKQREEAAAKRKMAEAAAAAAEKK